MKSRLFLLLKLFLLTIIFFVLQKPLFMLYNIVESPSESNLLTDIFAVMYHGLSLDSTIAGYTLILPSLLIWATWWTEKTSVIRPLSVVLQVYYVVLSLLFSIVFIVDTVLYSFWKFKLDATIFIYTDKPGDAIASVSVLFLLCGLFVAVLLACFYGMSYVKLIHSQRISVDSHKKFSWLVMVPVIVLLVFMIRGGVGKGTSNVTRAYYSESKFLNHASVNPIFNLLYSMMHQQDFASEYQYFDEPTRNSLIHNIYQTESIETDTLFSSTRPNIVLVVWEGCGASMVGAVGGNPEVTPCLNRMASEGILFSNCQSNSFRTDRGLVSILSGWLGFPAVSLMKLPEKCESLPGLAKSLRAIGYHTDFWYGGDISFTNMGGYMLQNGFQKTYSEKDFSRSEIFSEWGVADGTLFNRVLDDISKRSESVQPYFTAILTLTSHEPWLTPTKYLDAEVENSFAYTDACLGKFVEGLKDLPQWDNTLVVVLPDHGVVSREGQGHTSPDVVHVPIVMYGGVVKEPRKIDMLMNQSDLPATLLGQLRVSHDDFIFSRDILSKSYVYPTAIHCSHDEFAFYDSTGVSVYEFATDKIIGGSGDGYSIARADKGKAILQTLFLDAAGR